MTEQERLDEILRMTERYKMDEARRRLPMVEAAEMGPIDEYAYADQAQQPIAGAPGMPAMSTPPPTARAFENLRPRPLPPGVASLFGRGPQAQAAPGEATVRPYEPSWRERLQSGLMGDNPSPGRRRVSEGLMNVADFIPGIGSVLGAQEAGSRGDMQGAAIAAVPIPGARAARAAAKDLIKRPIEGPAKHPSLQKAIDDTVAKNAAIAEQQKIAAPAGPEFEPWRTDYGHYKLAWDPKKENYFPEKIESQGGQDLQKEIRKAEKALPGMERIFTPEDVFPQPSRPMDFPMRGFAKGTPDWVTAQLGPTRDKAAAAIARADELGGPMAGRFYELGRPYEDFVKEHGKRAGETLFDQWGQHMGATTSFARPPSNFRMASYQQQRTNQGLPLEELPPYPYGHMYWGNTHRPGVENLRSRGGFMDPEVRPKGTIFGGDLTGLADNTTIDQVETLGMGITNKSGKKQASPPGESYPAFMGMRDQLARDLGLSPKVAQAKSWAGFQKTPEEVLQYSDPMLKSMEDRILVTAKITGRDPRDIYRDWVKKGWPTLAVAGAPLVGEDEKR